MKNMVGYLTVVALGAAVLWAEASTAQASSIDEAVDGLAKQIASYLRAKNQNQLVIKDIDTPVKPSLNSSGTMLERRLAEALKTEHDVRISRSGNMALIGAVSIPAENGNGGPTAVRLTVSMQDGSGNPLGDFTRSVQIDDRAEVATLLGATFDAVTPNGAQQNPPGADPAAPNPAVPDPAVPNPAAPDPAVAGSPAPAGGAAPDAALNASIDAPAFDLRAGVPPTAGGPAPLSRVFPKPASPFGLELLVSSDGGQTFVPTIIEDDAGSAYCDILPDQIYKVRVFNFSNHDVAVELTIDGLNCFEFTEIPEYRRQRVWNIPAGGSGVIPGWHRTNQLVNEFLVAGLPPDLPEEDVSADLGPDRKKVGTVTAVFFASWPASQPKPDVEPIGARGGARQTVQGREIQVRNVVNVERHIGVTPLASVTIRYDKPRIIN